MSMAEISKELSLFFPAKATADLVSIFKVEVEKKEPNLAFLSILIGLIESQLTDPRQNSLEKVETFPVISFEDVNVLYIKYLALTEQLRNDLEQNDFSNVKGSGRCATRREIRGIANKVWSCLKKGFFKDKMHIQSMLGLVQGGYLDCFGIAFSVVAIAQTLSFKDVHLALSEDHSWISFGENSDMTAEVTWYGKGNETKRGMPIDTGLNELTSNWLYLGKHEIKCNRQLEVAALVSSINPGINSKCDSGLLGSVQQEILWMLYEKGILDTYPMALCNLADLEEIHTKRKEPSIISLYEMAIKCNEHIYEGYHVYPYTYFGGYLYRTGQYEEALEVWKKAARAASRYCHSGESEELYKDFVEIIGTFLPTICKAYKGVDIGFFSQLSTLMDFIQFFDWLCLWEERSTASVVHNDWAKTFVVCLGMFGFTLRSKIDFIEDDGKQNKQISNSSEEGCIITVNDFVLEEDRQFSTVLPNNTKKLLMRSIKMHEISKHIKSEKIENSSIKLQLTAPVSKAESKAKNSVENTDEPSSKRKRTRKY